MQPITVTGQSETGAAAPIPERVEWSPATGQLPALDGLRGVAILLVIGHNLEILDDPADRIGRVVELALNLGWIGVQLFFVLSGFLITRILIATKESPRYYQSFYVRRALRIFPLYYAILLLVFVAWPHVASLPPAYDLDRQHQAWLWLYLTNWFEPYGIGGKAFPHFWSLAVEEQFYLVWPFLIHRLNPRQVLNTCLAVAVLSLGARIAMVMTNTNPDAVYMWTTSRIDALALGGAAAALMASPQTLRCLAGRSNVLFWTAGGFGLCGFVLTHGYPRTSHLGQTLGYSWLAVTFALLMLAAAAPETKPGRWTLWHHVLRSRPLRVLGKYSYGMYIFHKPLHDLVGSVWLKQTVWGATPTYLFAIAYVLLATAATLVTAMLSYHLVEVRFLNLKQRLGWR